VVSPKNDISFESPLSLVGRYSGAGALFAVVATTFDASPPPEATK